MNTNPNMNPGAVYFMTNATEGKNQIVMHPRMADGRLGRAQAWADGALC